MRLAEVTRPQGRRHLHIKYNSSGEEKNTLTAELFTACLRASTRVLVPDGGMSEDKNR